MPLEDHSSKDPRDEVIRAAVRDAATIAGVLDRTIRASYHGPLRSEYVRVLRTWIEDLDGTLEKEADHLVATFGDRRITVTFR